MSTLRLSQQEVQREPAKQLHFLQKQIHLVVLKASQMRQLAESLVLYTETSIHTGYATDQ